MSPEQFPSHSPEEPSPQVPDTNPQESELPPHIIDVNIDDFLDKEEERDRQRDHPQLPS